MAGRATCRTDTSTTRVHFHDVYPPRHLLHVRIALMWLWRADMSPLTSDSNTPPQTGKSPMHMRIRRAWIPLDMSIWESGDRPGSAIILIIMIRADPLSLLHFSVSCRGVNKVDTSAKNTFLVRSPSRFVKKNAVIDDRPSGSKLAVYPFELAIPFATRTRKIVFNNLHKCLLSSPNLGGCPSQSGPVVQDIIKIFKFDGGDIECSAQRFAIDNGKQTSLAPRDPAVLPRAPIGGDVSLLSAIITLHSIHSPSSFALLCSSVHRGTPITILLKSATVFLQNKGNKLVRRNGWRVARCAEQKVLIRDYAAKDCEVLLNPPQPFQRVSMVPSDGWTWNVSYGHVYDACRPPPRRVPSTSSPPRPHRAHAAPAG
ncbi:hypothetical protein DFH08DRAFT_969628 [Mycena albidolilacea]|uniref:Uncharacterized protein n=1 Tax=Mycena albidolilacea TaxID=1033008 RepID=A0AAD6ZI80_9AGAR|nr:hypothetical protein DFH08DRAFT_969628 [Mycena albidolilacea]